MLGHRKSHVPLCSFVGAGLTANVQTPIRHCRIFNEATSNGGPAGRLPSILKEKRTESPDSSIRRASKKKRSVLHLETLFLLFGFKPNVPRKYRLSWNRFLPKGLEYCEGEKINVKLISVNFKRYILYLGM